MSTFASSESDTRAAVIFYTSQYQLNYQGGDFYVTVVFLASPHIFFQHIVEFYLSSWSKQNDIELSVCGQEHDADLPHIVEM